jgi:hypothetical protein
VLGLAVYRGNLAMVEFLLGLGFDLEAKTNVRFYLSYVACFFLFSSSVTGAINLFKVLQMYKCVEFSKTSVVTEVAHTARRQQLNWSRSRSVPSFLILIFKANTHQSSRRTVFVLIESLFST